MSKLDDPNRLNALRRTGLFDADVSANLDRYGRLVRKVLRSDVALVSLVDDRRQYFASHAGLPEPVASTRETPLSHSFCQHVVETDAPLIVRDAREDERVRDNLAVPDLGVIAYLGAPIRLSTGETLGSFCVIDIRPRDWTEDDLGIVTDLAAAVSAEIELRLASRAREEVIATVSHDLKNPIAAVLLNLDLLDRAGPGTELTRKISVRARRALEWMSTLVDKTLGEARTDFLNAREGVAASTTPFERLFDDLRGLTAAFAEEKDLRVVYSVEEAEYVSHAESKGAPGVAGSPIEILQILENIVGNAIRHSPAGSEIRIAARNGPEATEISIADEGPGIGPEQLDSIWKPFSRSTSSRTESEGGSRVKSHGLGLHIVKSLVERSGGSIAVESPPGAGATFRVRLPR